MAPDAFTSLADIEAAAGALEAGRPGPVAPVLRAVFAVPLVTAADRERAQSLVFRLERLRWRQEAQADRESA